VAFGGVSASAENKETENLAKAIEGGYHGGSISAKASCIAYRENRENRAAAKRKRHHGNERRKKAAGDIWHLKSAWRERRRNRHQQ